jgi:hypothetical protein
MKKFMFILVALIGFGISANAQYFCYEGKDKSKVYIEFYPNKNSNGSVSFFDGGGFHLSSSSGGINDTGKYKVAKDATKTSDGSYYVIEFYYKGESSPSLYGKYYRGSTSREGDILEKARIETLGRTFEACEKKK